MRCHDPKQIVLVKPGASIDADAKRAAAEAAASFAECHEELMKSSHPKPCPFQSCLNCKVVLRLELVVVWASCSWAGAVSNKIDCIDSYRYRLVSIVVC